MAEHASTKMSQGKVRGAVYAISGVLAFASAYEATTVAVASYVAASTTSPTVAGAIVGYSVGTIFAGMAAYDINLTGEYFEKAIQDFFYKISEDSGPCE